MLEQTYLEQPPSVPATPLLERSCYQGEQQLLGDNSVRKRLHSMMSENFQLKETISSLQKQLKQAQESIGDLKEKLRAALQEISANDEIIVGHQEGQKKSNTFIVELEGSVQVLKDELQVEKEAVSRLEEHNKNLETEAQLMAEIKQKYQIQAKVCKNELDQSRLQNEKFQLENIQLTHQITKLMEELDGQQHEIEVRRKQMEDYEAFVLSKLNQAKNDPEFHEKCLAEKDKYYCKYLKYKEKTVLYKKQRDQLLAHLSSVSQEVGSASMRKYLE